MAQFIECTECCGEGQVTEQFEPIPGIHSEMGVSVRAKVKCSVCKGKKVLPVPEDYVGLEWLYGPIKNLPSANG